MVQISQDFAPPFKLIAPFFVIGSLLYLFVVLFLFFIDFNHISYQSPCVIALVHLFLLGFVMMVIFGAMAQLVPVVLEVGHFAVELFYAIWPLLLIGSVMMAVGFAYVPRLLPYGGMVVLISMLIFVFEIFLTLFKVPKFSIIKSSLLIANIFLFLGIIFGLLMALSYAGEISVDIDALLQAHLFLLVGGYISITIMGISLVLLPMFTLAHSFSQKPLHVALYLMSFSVVDITFASLFGFETLQIVGYVTAVISMMVYFYLVYIIFTTRPRKENDVYALSMVFAYIAMLISVAMVFLYLLFPSMEILMAAGWLYLFGFIGFVISGHIYKIIPFLVWFERFSPLVGKQKVPMLADMLPKRSSQAQFVYTGVGVILVYIAILFQIDKLFYAGVSFLLVGVVAFIRSILYMINFKEG